MLPNQLHSIKRSATYRSVVRVSHRHPPETLDAGITPGVAEVPRRAKGTV